jgi:hypothetical protein
VVRDKICNSVDIQSSTEVTTGYPLHIRSRTVFSCGSRRCALWPRGGAGWCHAGSERLHLVGASSLAHPHQRRRPH